MGDLTLFEALTGGAFDRISLQHSGEFDQNFSKKSNAPGFALGGMGGFGIDRYIRLVSLTHQSYMACIRPSYCYARQKFGWSMSVGSFIALISQSNAIGSRKK